MTPFKILRVEKIAIIFFLLAISAYAQTIPSGTLDAMQWRLIGPFRGGRVTSVCGVPTQPNIYYMGTPGGGIWKTEDAGRIWKPIFDHEHVASIGAVVVSLSNPSIVYAGTGEQTPGDGIYKSKDAGATWTNIGLSETHFITAMIVDPTNADVVLVAAAGDRASGSERGVYKTTDGGRNWSKVLFKDTDTAAADLQADPDDPKILYASFWHRPENPFDPNEEKKKTQDATVYKSTDQGSTWAQVGGNGLPTEPMGRVGLAVAPGTHGMRVYAITGEGLFRSEDGGANWTRSTTDPRIIGSSYISGVSFDPKNADIVYAEQTSLYRSTDGGRTFEAWVGAPSGDDFHVMWINPLHTENLILGVDQGAIVTVDGGATWSSWYNQPTGQFYHVSTDQRYPYYVYAAQQDSGTAGVPSRSNFGEITYRDWAPVGGFEFAYIEADPANPDYIYTGGWYGTLLRFDKTTGQITHLFVRTPRYRTANMAPFAFSPQDPHTLYLGAQFVLKSNDGGRSWQEISPDLTQKPEPGDKKEGDKEKKPNPRRAVITTMALSSVKAGEIWAGSGTGLIHVTTDGKNWTDVTVPGLPEGAGLTTLEASHHDAGTAYAVISDRRDRRSFVYRTRDYGKHWESTETGIPGAETVQVVREDPERKGLLYAGTQKIVYVSFDQGDHWQSLQLNMPVAPVTDITVHGNDLVISTYGRSLWILDNITPLRQFDQKLLDADITLLRPEPTVRTRWDMYQDTPLPIETPAAPNPPDGAMIDYFLKSKPSGDIQLSIYDSQNNLVRQFTTVAPDYDRAPPNVPSYWFAPPRVLPKNPGLNRLVWDLRYPSPKTLRYGYFNEKLDYIEYTLADDAIPGHFPREQPRGPYVVPGEYSVVLTVDGKIYRQSLTVTEDPRVHVSQADLVEQLRVAQSISAQMGVTYDGYNQTTQLHDAIEARQKSVGTDASKKDVVDALKSLNDQTEDIENGKPMDFGIGPLNRELARFAEMVETSDERPATPLQEGARQYCEALLKRLAQWRDLNEKKIGPVNDLLRKNNLEALPVAANIPSAPECKIK